MYLVMAINEEKHAFIALVRTKGIGTKLCKSKDVKESTSILCSRMPEVINSIEKEKALLKWPEPTVNGKFKEWLQFPDSVIYKLDPLFKAYCNLCKL